MDKIIEVINNLSSFVQYFATGFLFLSAYTFAGCLQRESKEEYFIVKSITASFVLNSFVSVIFEWTGLGKQYYFLGLVVSAFAWGLLLGRGRSFVWVNCISEKLFRHTITDNIFQSLRNSVVGGNCLCIRFGLQGNENIYEGQISEINSIYDHPVLVIRYYVIQEKSGEIRDFSECDCAKMIVQWSEMKNVEMASRGWKGVE